jgi:uncharacterized membrane protein
MIHRSSLSTRLALGVGAFFVADLITGLVAFSVIALATLWFFSYSWIQLAGEYATAGISFGSPLQLGLAWVGAFITLPMIVVAIFLALRAHRLPKQIYHLGEDSEAFHTPG